jgi:polyphosphate kinase
VELFQIGNANSEHCRHWYFKGKMVIDGVEMPECLLDIVRAPLLAVSGQDVSILAFNVRVLDWAKRPEVPLLERLRYLCIVSSNLDEFFEVRADLHMAAFRNNDTKGAYNINTFETVYQTARNLVQMDWRQVK